MLHDLNLACRYAHHLVAMSDGRIVAAGAPADVITEDTVREVFGLDSLVIPDPISGTPLVVPYSGVACDADMSDGRPDLPRPVLT